ASAQGERVWGKAASSGDVCHRPKEASHDFPERPLPRDGRRRRTNSHAGAAALTAGSEFPPPAGFWGGRLWARGGEIRLCARADSSKPTSLCLPAPGEKLDYKACEALEEIFKRVQFKIVDLEQTSLDEDGASALFDMIEYYESATHLNISFNKHIGTRGWQAAAHMMRKVRARSPPVLVPHQIPKVPPRALAVVCRPATALKMNMNLRELYLADNKLNGLQDSAQLGNLLKFNCYIQILDLRNNHILDSGLAYICEGLKEQRKGLVTLVLWNNQLTHSGMAYLGMTLPHAQSLETLNLGHNPIGNEGVRNLKNGLIGNRSVLRLGLASTKLTCEGAVAVAEFIAESPRLLRLDLRENEIKTGGLMALSLALKVNHSLLRLDLDREPKKESVKSFIETQKALLAEIQNGCKRNFILAKEKEEKEQKLQQSASMPEITVTEALEEGPGEDDSAPAEDGDDRDGATDSDSDTEEEEEEEEDAGLATKDLSQA
uniref:Protein phosphatase 1 regulatory subunit 37 n=1 Tax=Anser cygnoides TaxID=8845 RepID=A0A8B9EME9_ANSCY